VTNILNLELAVGYLHQNYNGGSIHSFNSPNYHLSVNWTPRPTWLIKAGIERALDASPRNDVPAIFRTSYNLSAEHVFTTRLLVSGSVSYQREAYQSIDRTDRRLDAALTAQYRLASHFGLLASAGYRTQAGGDIGRSYHGAIVSVALRVAV
jgi:hypothetical protein